MSRRLAVTGEPLRKLREWRATPRGKRRQTLEGIAAALGLALCTATRAAYAKRGYEKVQP